VKELLRFEYNQAIVFCFHAKDLILRKVSQRIQMLFKYLQIVYQVIALYYISQLPVEGGSLPGIEKPAFFSTFIVEKRVKGWRFFPCWDKNAQPGPKWLRNLHSCRRNRVKGWRFFTVLV
jgi:hypothetical protein